MKIAIPLLFICTLATSASPTGDLPGIAEGPFKPDDRSLAAYQCPEWFRDAKFGIWSHWGPQAVPRQGDWYARNLYEHTEYCRLSGQPKGQSAHNKHHLKYYGHPSRFGYKDILPLWKAEKWDPDALMALYKKTGARYFVSMGVHIDNFFLWDSKIHRWNSVRVGPHKDVVGLWRKAARAHGLRFGVSEHLAPSFNLFQTSHQADRHGPMKGVPYDGNDPQYQDLYHKPAAPGDNGYITNDPENHRRWFACVKELVDLYQPDLLYSDCMLPFEDIGRSLIAHYYNQSAALNAGSVQAVYNCKETSGGRWVHDIERGVALEIDSEPWQTDTSIGDWFYRTGQPYMSAEQIVRMLVDIVSKNGNLLLNVVQTPEGDLEPDVVAILEDVGEWMALNGEGIYGTRPWKIHGEGPDVETAPEAGPFGGIRDVPRRPYTHADIRFTVSKDGGTLHVFCFGVPKKEFRIKSLARDAAFASGPVESVELLGSGVALAWKQEPDALVIEKPSSIPRKEAVCFKVRFGQ